MAGNRCQLSLVEAIQRAPKREEVASLQAMPAAPPSRNPFGVVRRAKERAEMIRHMSTLAAVDEVLRVEGLQKEVHQVAMQHAALLERVQGAAGEEAELRRLMNTDRKIQGTPGALAMAKRLWKECNGSC